MDLSSIESSTKSLDEEVHRHRHNRISHEDNDDKKVVIVNMSFVELDVGHNNYSHGDDNEDAHYHRHRHHHHHKRHHGNLVHAVKERVSSLQHGLSDMLTETRLTVFRRAKGQITSMPSDRNTTSPHQHRERAQFDVSSVEIPKGRLIKPTPRRQSFSMPDLGDKMIANTFRPIPYKEASCPARKQSVPRRYSTGGMVVPEHPQGHHIHPNVAGRGELVATRPHHHHYHHHYYSHSSRSHRRRSRGAVCFEQALLSSSSLALSPRSTSELSLSGVAYRKRPRRKSSTTHLQDDKKYLDDLFDWAF
jgi:hypothetical protein